MISRFALLKKHYHQKVIISAIFEVSIRERMKTEQGNCIIFGG